MDKFLNLEEEKQIQIITAAMKEFSEKGYDQASTNQIIKDAGIAKGTLFYYFKSKKNLYKYLIEYGLDFIKNEYLNKIDESEKDFIEKYKQVGKLKMKAYAKNSYVFNFFGTLYLNDYQDMGLSEELINEIEKTRKNAYSKLFTKIDTALFRQDMEAEKVLKFINWTLDGYQNELLARLKGKDLSSIDFEPYWDEFYQNLDILKKIFYQNKGE